MMNDAIKDKGNEEEEDRKKGEEDNEGRRNQGLDQAEGGEETNGEIVGLNKKRKRQM